MRTLLISAAVIYRHTQAFVLLTITLSYTDKVLAFHKSNYVGSRMVVAGYGVEHESLCKLVESHFSHVPAGVCKAIPPVIIDVSLRMMFFY